MATRPSRWLACLLVCVGLAACASGSRRPSGDGGGGIGDDGGGTTPFDAGPRPPATGCEDSARWIYLVDSGNALLRFEPDSATLTEIGRVSCTPTSQPFSMAVDRHATAYVLHQDHTIYEVSTADASCRPTGYVPNQLGFELFGMGFVSESEGSDAESLFIAGGPESGVGLGSSTLGRIDVGSWSVSRVGPVAGSPELTGTGTGQLWGFFPDATPMAVRQIDPANGGTLRQFDVSVLDTSGIGVPNAWAFAFWGGRYYMFYMGALDDSTNIWRLTPETGVVEPVRMNTGYRIVGAGVSTCAPTILI